MWGGPREDNAEPRGPVFRRRDFCFLFFSKGKPFLSHCTDWRLPGQRLIAEIFWRRNSSRVGRSGDASWGSEEVCAGPQWAVSTQTRARQGSPTRGVLAARQGRAQAALQSVLGSQAGSVGTEGPTLFLLPPYFKLSPGGAPQQPCLSPGRPCISAPSPEATPPFLATCQRRWPWSGAWWVRRT